MRLLTILFALTACGQLSPLRRDAGVGGGAATGGGAGSITGGGSGAGGGIAPTGGGFLATGGGQAATGGGTTATGGGGVTICTGSSCDGCCDAQLGCLFGTATDHCGSGGATCGSCGASLACNRLSSNVYGGQCGPPQFSFARMTFSPVPGTPSIARQVLGLARRPSGELWAALGDSTVYRAAPGSLQFNVIPGFPAPLLSTKILDIVATTTQVFILRAKDVLSCTGACDTFSAFSKIATFTGVEEGSRLCARGDRALATALSSGMSALYEYKANTNTFVSISADLSVPWAGRCFIDASGDVYVVSDGSQLAIYTAAGGLSSATINLNGHPAASFRDVVTFDGKGFVVGGGSGGRWAVRSVSEWIDLAPDTSANLMTVVLAAGADVYAGAYTNSLGDETPWLYKWNGTSFVQVVPQPLPIDVTAGLVVSDHELYFAGASRSGSTYEVLRGTK